MIRKIIRIGNSDGVVIPAGAMRAHKLKQGDHVEVIISPPGELAKQLEFLQDLEAFRRFRAQSAPQPDNSQLF